MRLRHCRRRRWSGARRRRRRIARNAVGADVPRRPRFQAKLDAAGVFWLGGRQWPQGNGRTGNRSVDTGCAADFVTIDLDRLDRDQFMPVDPIELLFARGNASLLRDVVVDGRTIVSDGRCLGVDLPAIDKELRGIYRANAGKLGSFQRAWPPLSAS